MRKRVSTLFFIVATMLWGLAFSAQKDAAVIPAPTVSAIRALLASLFLFLLMPLTDRLTKNGRRAYVGEAFLGFTRTELAGGLVCGIILGIATILQQLGLGEGTDAGKAAFITALYVVLVPIFSAFLGKKPRENVIISVIMAVVGFYFLCITPGASLAPSDFLVLMCALVYAVHIIVIDRFSPRCDGVRLSCVQFLVAFVISGIMALIFDMPLSLSLIGSKLPSLLYLGICSGGIAYTLQIIGQRDTDPAVASVLLSLESVFGVIGGALLLGESMSPREYIGCGIVFIAVLLSQIDPIELIKNRRNDNHT